MCIRDRIEAYAAGLTNDPPRRMCDRCKADFGAIADREVRCRTSGCKKTWTWARGGQLARAVRGKTGDPYPQYCENCSKDIVDLEDRQIACKTDNCTGTWTW